MFRLASLLARPCSNAGHAAAVRSPLVLRTMSNGAKSNDEKQYIKEMNNLIKKTSVARQKPGFEFSFAKEDMQFQLITGTRYDPEKRKEIREEIDKHSNFSSILKTINRKENPVEYYFLRVCAANLAKNPSMTPDQKEMVMTNLRDKVLEYGKE
eukprot:m.209084 g.209084  ORF g.209084 m.209084 type:complete len:154 (+) comp15813_c0_seq1:205-666(+)